MVRAVDRGGHWLGLADIGTAALAAGKQVDDLGAQAREETAIGQSSLQLGRLEDAHARLQRVLALHRQAGDRVGQGVSHRHLAHLQSRQGQPEQALDHARQTLTWFQAAGHRLGQARALNTSAGCTPNSATSDRLSLTARGPSASPRNSTTRSASPPSGPCRRRRRPRPTGPAWLTGVGRQSDLAEIDFDDERSSHFHNTAEDLSLAGSSLALSLR